MALHLDRSRSDALCAWLTAHGIEPNTVPTDADMTISDTDDGRVLHCEVMVRSEDGRLVLDDRGDGPAIEMRTVPLVAEPPEWWTPYEKPTREQLLATVERVRKLHAPIAGEGDTRWCQVCSQEEIQPQPIGWWVPWPCPTVAALPKENADG